MKGKGELYSLRMHASVGKKHLCGAERIVSKDGIPETVAEMAKRALSHPGGEPTSIVIGTDRLVTDRIRAIPLLPLRTIETKSPEESAAKAAGLLMECGVSQKAVDEALSVLASGAASSGGNMRGAMIIHAQSGRRLEPDRERGVRVTRMDLTDPAREALERRLHDLQIYHPRVVEASVLASKVALVPGIIAEVCRSDDPGYTTGYVASKNIGYVRLTQMKEEGNPFGGRAFFVDDSSPIEMMVKELESVPYLVTEVPGV